jgi:hypothetical protein
MVPLMALSRRTSSPRSEGSSGSNSGDMGRESPISASSVNFDERPRSFASINVNEVGFRYSLATLLSSPCWRLKGQFHEMNIYLKVNLATGALFLWFSKVLISFLLRYVGVPY